MNEGKEIRLSSLADKVCRVKWWHGRETGHSHSRPATAIRQKTFAKLLGHKTRRKKMNTHVDLLSSDTLQGTKVVNGRGENLGHLEEVMLDLASGRVAYAVLSFGGVLGIGNKLFAVPWQALTINEDEEEIMMEVSKESLENAPGFDKDNWPQSATTTWLGEVHDYYGYPYTS
jgi:sporulation protein YlmC with PRC-barrel domain